MPNVKTESELPLVSIIILYYKRREIIKETLCSALSQDYPRCEIIVVDNHSQDDLRQCAAALGNISIIELPENRGACAGRNVGIRQARGDIFVFLDDDVCFASSGEVSRIVAKFRERPDVHVLALQICEPRTGKVRLREWCHTRPYDEYADKEFETNWFGEGESATRREIFERCGLYYEPLYYGAEGHDMVVRILDNGFRVLYTPDIRVNHWASEKGRTTRRQYYYFTRNFIWMAYKDYGLWDGLCFVVPKILMMIYFACRSGAFAPVLKGLWDGVRGLARVHTDRTPISKGTVRYMAEQDKFRPSLIGRLARHRAEPQI